MHDLCARAAAFLDVSQRTAVGLSQVGLDTFRREAPKPAIGTIAAKAHFV